MISKLTTLIKKTEQQARLWKYAAWTAPFVALAIILGEMLLGFESIINITSISIVVIFIATSVFWWWWAIDKIYELISAFNKTDQSFDKIANELQKIRKDIKDNNLF